MSIQLSDGADYDGAVLDWHDARAAAYGSVLAQRYQFSGNQGSGGGVDASFDLSGYLQPVAGTGTTDAR